MSTTVSFSHGIDKSIQLIHLTPSEADDYVQQHHDLNEVLFLDGKPCRAFIDIDGCMPLDTPEDEFNSTHQNILFILSSLDLGTPFSITTSSKYNNKDWKTSVLKHKLSYVIVFTRKCGSKYAVAQWTRDVICPLLKEALSLVIPFVVKGVDHDLPSSHYLDYDNSGYRQSGKMRCIFSTKPNENRPRMLHSKHEIVDTFITYVPSNCEPLPEPELESKSTEHAVIPLEPAQQDTLYTVLMSLSPRRADDRKDWISIGMVLFNEGYPCDMWDEFSKQSPKYRYGECQRLWKGFRQGALTQRTLWKMLKEDSPSVFHELWAAYTTPERTYDLLIDGGHRTLAEHFINCMPNEYLYHESSGWWYMQANRTWANTDKNIPPTLPIIISRTLSDDAEIIRTIYRKRVMEDDIEGDTQNKYIFKSLLKLQENLLQIGFIKCIIEFCKALYAEQTNLMLDKFETDDIHRVMDSNPMLFAFQDAVHDFTIIDGQPVGRRSIEPTDYIRTTCGYPYPFYDPNARQQVEDTLKTIWSKQVGEIDPETGIQITYGDDGETYEYTMNMLATSLCGVRWMEAFYILTGSGRNGKGLLFELLQRVFGNYYYTIPVQVFTTKLSDSTGANPEAYNMKGKRLVCCSEPEINEKLQEGTVKYYTGGDEITGRALYGNPIKFKPQSGTYIQCNTIPIFNGITRGGMLRNRVILFPFEFCANPTLACQKKGNADIKNRLCKSNEWRNAMFFILLDHFENIRGKSLDAIPTPELVKARTDEYIRENNAVGVWWEETYERDPKSHVLTKDAWTAFKADTNSSISDKAFAAALRFNLLEPVRLRSGPNRDKMALIGWKNRGAT